MVAVRPVNERYAFAPVNAPWKTDGVREQNFNVVLCFVKNVLVHGKACNRVEYLYDRNCNEIIATYYTERNEAEKFYPTSAESFYLDLFIISAPEEELTAEQKEQRKRIAR